MASTSIKPVIFTIGPEKMESIHSERQSVAQLLSYTAATAASHADAPDRKNTLRGHASYTVQNRITLAQVMIFVDVTRSPQIAS
jgi:hypothetical protein